MDLDYPRGDWMGKLKLNLKGDVQDIVTMHDHLEYHTKRITDIVWLRRPDIQIAGDGEAEFTVTI